MFDSALTWNYYNMTCILYIYSLWTYISPWKITPVRLYYCLWWFAHPGSPAMPKDLSPGARNTTSIYSIYQWKTFTDGVPTSRWCKKFRHYPSDAWWHSSQSLVLKNHLHTKFQPSCSPRTSGPCFTADKGFLQASWITPLSNQHSTKMAAIANPIQPCKCKHVWTQSKY